MFRELVLTMYFLMWHFLVILACLFAISGLDDVFIDFYFWSRILWRILKSKPSDKLTYEQLSERSEQRIAVLVPCWNESSVIGTMLRHNCYSIDYRDFVFFVGVYPNDPETVAEVQAVVKGIDNVQCVIGEQPGPTNKASNLNNLYLAIKDYEVRCGKPFDIYVLHDSEDVIHPLSFKLYNYLIPQKDMIQIPVFPLEVGYFNFTHWLYADEFAENHTKDIIVRESIRAHVPSAGVGTAFSRQALQLLEDEVTGLPFSTNSLTEDYRTSLAIRMRNLKQAFVMQSVVRTRWQRKGILFQRYIKVKAPDYIATRALFPTEYYKAVRQKARWIIGIVFQEWDHTQWPKNWIIRYSLMHDRKSFITHFINGFGYCVFLFWLIYSSLISTRPEYPSLQEQFNAHPWVWWLIIFVSCIMFERAIQRMIALWKIYGWRPVLLLLPRLLYGNVLNLHALLRAYRIYFAATKGEKKIATSTKQPAWDKTEHFFPGRHVLVPYRKKLGDLLMEKKIITLEQLHRAIQVQQQTSEPLGEILLRLGMIQYPTLVSALADQYNLPLFSVRELEEAKAACLLRLPKREVRWVKKNRVHPIRYDIDRNTMTVALDDPTNELLLRKILDFFGSKTVEFALLKTDQLAEN